jgi:MoxR-like ATPase
LPEAQLDRFLLKILVPFPGPEVLRDVARQTILPPADIEPVLDELRMTSMIRVARAVPLATAVLDYAVAVIMATHAASSPLEKVQRFVYAGASPRGLQALVVGSQVRALLEGRYNVSVHDIKALAHAALRHRILLNFEGQAAGLTPDVLIDEIVASVPTP